MNALALLKISVYLGVLIALAWPLGIYMARVYEDGKLALDRVLGPLERLVYRWSGVDPGAEMNWKTYGVAMLLFNMAGMALLYFILRVQASLPFNPQQMGPVRPITAFNIAASFVTNTNWQNYGGEMALSYLTQMLGLTVQNFLSAATGMAVLAALIRGFNRRETDRIGNFWADLVRGTLYILLPLALILAVTLVSLGVVQTFRPSHQVTQLEGGRTQTVALGPVASQVAIKQLGTNGGGFFNVNSAHPFENPTPLANFLELLAILLIPAALCITFGRMVGDKRQGWALLAAMTLVLLAGLLATLWAEQRGNPRLSALGADERWLEAAGGDPLQTQAGGNMEGKEVRFGITDSALWAVATTAASNGSVNSMHDSYTPLGGLAPMVMMKLGEVIFGGVGSGLYGMLVFVIMTVFMAGLMVGRTPEYLGKKIGPFEMKMASLVILIPPLLVLAGTAAALLIPSALAARANPGAHGLSEILYAFASMSNNNGSAFAGLSVDSNFYNLAGGLAMLVGRFWLAIPVLAIAGALARKKVIPASAGTLPTHTPLFIALLVMIVLLVGALTFLPALALGPIIEHFQMLGIQ